MKKVIIGVLGILIAIALASKAIFGWDAIGFPADYPSNCVCQGVEKHYFDDDNYWEKSVCYGVVTMCIIID